MRRAQPDDRIGNAEHGEDALTPGAQLPDFRLRRELCNKSDRRDAELLLLHRRNSARYGLGSMTSLLMQHGKEQCGCEHNPNQPFRGLRLRVLIPAAALALR
jgi:hypothetical protein